MTYQGPEKRTTPDLSSELRSIAEGVGQLVERIDQSLPEERMRELVAAAVDAERRGRIRLIVAVLGPLLIVLAVGLATLAQSDANHTQGNEIVQTSRDAKVVADYVRSCLETPAAQRDPAVCGADETAKIIKGLIGSINCSLLIPPAQRTEEKLDACAAAAFGG